MFRTGYNKGFQMSFKNGLTISVQWGVGNYCERRSLQHTHLDDMKNLSNESPDAEIMIWDEQNNEYNFGYDHVKGFVGTEEVAGWIMLVSTAKNMNDLNTLVEDTKTKALVVEFNPSEY